MAVTPEVQRLLDKYPQELEGKQFAETKPGGTIQRKADQPGIPYGQIILYGSLLLIIILIGILLSRTRSS